MDAAETFAPALAMALAWQPAETRASLEALFAFDAHLGRLVSKASEPLLGQMRLTWWRERLAEPVTSRPAGDPVLAELARHWQGSEAAIIGLVDGWEELLSAEALPAANIAHFALGRGRALAEFATRVGEGPYRDGAERAGRRWALADFAWHTRDAAERNAALEAARAIPVSGRLPRTLRGVAVLSALADRAIEREEPLVHGRGAALVALRVGTIGR